MPDLNGFWTKEEQRAEMVSVEAALRARPRSAEEIAGDLTPDEEKAVAAMDDRLAAASAATSAAHRGVVAAEETADWRSPNGRELERHEEAVRALTRIARAEEDVLGEWNRLHTRIGEARQARRQGAVS
jgi:hypothetical protein